MTVSLFSLALIIALALIVFALLVLRWREQPAPLDPARELPAYARRTRRRVESGGAAGGAPDLAGPGASLLVDVPDGWTVGPDNALIPPVPPQPVKPHTPKHAATRPRVLDRTVPVAPTEDAPPWDVTTAQQPVYGQVPQVRVAEAERLAGGMRP